MTKPTKQIDSSRIMAALSKRHRPPAWALLEQVSNGTGRLGNRYADALALGLWPSRGIDLHGFEIKVYRNDWLRELERPDKADEIADVCDYWWIATAPGVIELQRDPVPDSWGVMVLEGRSLAVHKPAERRAERVEIDRYMLAAILRRATERMIPLQSIESRLEEARQEGREVGERTAQRCNHDSELRELGELKASVGAFKSVSGIDIDRYSGRRLGELMKAAATMDYVRSAWQLKQADEHLSAALERVRAARAGLAADTPEAT